MFYDTKEYKRPETRRSNLPEDADDVNAGRQILAVVPRCPSALIPPNKLPPGNRVWRDTLLVLPDSVPATRRRAVSTRMFSGVKYLFAGDILKGDSKNRIVKALNECTRIIFSFRCFA